jgi:hypothetical protein
MPFLQGEQLALPRRGNGSFAETAECRKKKEQQEKQEMVD